MVEIRTRNYKASDRIRVASVNEEATMLLQMKASDEAPGYRKPILDATENMQALITDIQNLQ